MFIKNKCYVTLVHRIEQLPDSNPSKESNVLLNAYILNNIGKWMIHLALTYSWVPVGNSEISRP